MTSYGKLALKFASKQYEFHQNRLSFSILPSVFGSGNPNVTRPKSGGAHKRGQNLGTRSRLRIGLRGVTFLFEMPVSLVEPLFLLPHSILKP